MAVFTIVVLTIVAACGRESLRGPGEECFASSECASGLVCDFGVDPPVCSEMGSNPVQPDAPGSPPPSADARPAPDGAPPDGAPEVPDAAAPDASPPDASLPDAAM